MNWPLFPGRRVCHQHSLALMIRFPFLTCCVMLIGVPFANFSSRAASLSPNTNLTAREQAVISAAKPDAAPRFNGARVVGIRPGTPFLYSVAVTGTQPIDLTVEGLPAGLAFAPETGLLSGSLQTPGDYNLRIRARNSAGAAKNELRICCGERLALLPPMGWNSYDAFGDSVTESEVLANAKWLKENLQPAGWDTVVVDFRWYDSKADGIRVQNPEGVTIDEFGRCIPPTNRFASAANGAGFKSLANQIHQMGLKFGIHIMRGIPRKAVQKDLPIAGSTFKASQAVLAEGDINRTCVWNRDMFGVDADKPAGKAWYTSIARQYAEWGVDYIKCDDIADLQRGKRYGAAEIEALSDALRDSSRSIILSLSPGPSPVVSGPHLKQFANLWRISGDFWDNWKALDHNFDLLAEWLPDAGPGHWPDADMIPLGHVCERNCDVRPGRWTRLTRDEQVTLMSLWALAPSPLMLGMDLLDNDEWTTALLTNPEVLALNQDPAGLPARRRRGPPNAPEIWTKELADGSTAVGVFNRGELALRVALPWRFLNFHPTPQVRDLWLRKDLESKPEYIDVLAPHSCVLMQVRAK